MMHIEFVQYIFEDLKQGKTYGRILRKSCPIQLGVPWLPRDTVWGHQRKATAKLLLYHP